MPETFKNGMGTAMRWQFRKRFLAEAAAMKERHIGWNCNETHTIILHYLEYYSQAWECRDCGVRWNEINAAWVCDCHLDAYNRRKAGDHSKSWCCNVHYFPNDEHRDHWLRTATTTTTP